MVLASYKGPVRWAGDLTKCLDVQGGNPSTGAQVGLWACRAEHPNQQFFWSFTDGRIRWLTHPSFCLGAAGNIIALERCETAPAALPIEAGEGYKAICLGDFYQHCLKVEAPGNYALDGTPIKVLRMHPTEQSTLTYPWVFRVDPSCSGESFCPQLANCYEDCRLSGAFDQACWQSSCCPSDSKREYNHSSFNYYVCSFTNNPCMEGCNAEFQSQRCGKDGTTYCPRLANCYEACRLQKQTPSCRDLPCCPKQVDSFNESIEDFYLCADLGNNCLTRCNEMHDAYRYCDGRSYCPQLAECYEECHDLGIAAELCSSRSRCCPAFVPADGIGQRYADPDLGYYTCDDGLACLERCNGRFAYEEPNSLQSRHIPRPDVLEIIARLQQNDDDNPPPGSSPLASAILVTSVLLLFVAAMLALLQRRKQIPAWTGPIGRSLQRQRDIMRAEEETMFQRLAPDPERSCATRDRSVASAPTEAFSADFEGVESNQEYSLPLQDQDSQEVTGQDLPRLLAEEELRTESQENG